MSAGAYFGDIGAEDSQVLFQTLFELAPTPALIHDGRQILLANDACARFLGYESAEELAGIEIGPLVHPDDQIKVGERVRRMMVENWTAPMTEERFRRKDGSWAYGNTVAAPTTLLGRRVIHVVAIDLAPTRAALEALHESEQRFRDIFDSSADSKVIHDGERVVLANATAYRQFGIELGTDPVGIPVGRFIHPDDRAATIERAKRLATEDVVEPLEITLVRMDGTTWPGEVASSVVTIDGRRLIQSTFRDLTERRRVEEQLVEYRTQLERLLEERTESLDRVRADLHAVTAVASATVERRDPYTGGHQRRVAVLAVEIAKRNGLSDAEIEHLDVAARLHDIGKVCVPAEILSKPATLSPIEYELVKEHAEAGYEILCSTEVSSVISEIVRQHHERLDGSGYPRGLSGVEMLPAARILAVADVVEAMASHRPYRPAVGIPAARAEIVRGRGTSYDADAVDACVAILDAGFDFDEAPRESMGASS